MNWKSELQLRDIDPGQQLEAVCRLCGHTHYVDPEQFLQHEELQFLYLDEVEKMTVCRARGCRGTVRLALTHAGETEGFAGGLA
ncbi:MAG: hypothetical protein C0605_04780 [Hyphomicrobiales bacterium]|nr:MAG: hypothetical protein C0605_04780 [Hyphomicrobiales bacterium]